MAKRKGPDQMVGLTLRLPEALRAKLEAEAEKANRSLNSEILWRLGQTFTEQWQRFIAGIEERERRDKELREEMLQDPEFQKVIADFIAKHRDREGK